LALHRKKNVDRRGGAKASHCVVKLGAKTGRGQNSGCGIRGEGDRENNFAHRKKKKKKTCKSEGWGLGGTDSPLPGEKNKKKKKTFTLLGGIP